MSEKTGKNRFADDNKRNKTTFEETGSAEESTENVKKKKKEAVESLSP